MVELVLAQGGGESWLGPAIRAVLFTSAGAALIAVGVRRRLARARWDREDDRRLLQSGGPALPDEHRSSPPASRGVGLIVVGAILAFLGLLHILDLVATLHLSGVI
ncbi:hypothetical protein [Mycobacterium sp. SMC-4]|uniref:hypothetical protein n=1 Tax=Mycobacterium sp. SMC-4 TaxID=2857059 RepID=UPI003D00D104